MKLLITAFAATFIFASCTPRGSGQSTAETTLQSSDPDTRLDSKAGMEESLTRKDSIAPVVDSLGHKDTVMVDRWDERRGYTPGHKH